MIPNNTVSPKPRSKKHVILRLARYIFAHKWMVLGAVSLTIASNLLALLGPALSGYAIDAIGTEAGMADFNQVYFYCFHFPSLQIIASCSRIASRIRACWEIESCCRSRLIGRVIRTNCINTVSMVLYRCLL